MNRREQAAEERLLAEQDTQRLEGHAPAPAVERYGDAIEALIELADRMRQVGGSEPHRLYSEVEEASRNGDVEIDQIGAVYRHLLMHSGALVKAGGGRFYVCPHCLRQLVDVPT